MKQVISSLLDACYPPFRRFMPLQTFRYVACGGLNTVLGLLAYYLGYTLLDGQNLDLGFYAFKPHVAALFLSVAVSFSLGFLLNKYLVFTGSVLRGRVQLFRYGLSFSTNLVINYLLLKCFVEWLQWPAMPSQILTTALIVSISFVVQKHFSFRGRG